MGNRSLNRTLVARLSKVKGEKMNSERKKAQAAGARKSQSSHQLLPERADDSVPGAITRNRPVADDYNVMASEIEPVLQKVRRRLDGNTVASPHIFLENK